MNEIVLATDLGGTNLRMSAIDREGKILYRTKTRHAEIGKYDTKLFRQLQKRLRNVKEILSELGVVKAIATAVPGTVDCEKGNNFKAPNVPALNGFRISATIEEETRNLPCFLENDANAAAVGENWLGASKGFKNSICVTLGTGVGGGIIIDGKVLARS